MNTRNAYDLFVSMDTRSSNLVCTYKLKHALRRFVSAGRLLQCNKDNIKPQHSRNPASLLVAKSNITLCRRHETRHKGHNCLAKERHLPRWYVACKRWLRITMRTNTTSTFGHRLWRTSGTHRLAQLALVFLTSHRLMCLVCGPMPRD